MGEVKAKGLCLRGIDYADNDKLCTIYLLEYGKTLVKFRGVKKPKAKLAFASTPLCLGDYIINEKMGYHTCINCSMITSFMPLWRDLNKFYCAMSAVELLDKFTREAQINDDICLIVINFLNTLIDTKPELNAYAQFLLEFAVVSGYGINLESLQKENITCADNARQVINALNQGAMLDEIKPNAIASAIRAMLEYLAIISEQRLVASWQCIDYFISNL